MTNQPLCSSPPLAELRMSVIVPAKNEAAEIRSTLRALYQQVDASDCPLDKRCYEVIVLANNCTDNTADVARKFARDYPGMRLHVAEVRIPEDRATIGYVRRRLMDEAYDRLMSLGRPRGIIASTDGDSIVSSSWIYHTLLAFDRGADAVGGRILTVPRPGEYRRYYLQDVGYRYLQAQLEAMIDANPADPWPRHFQNFGPSLAVTCAMYARAGRMPTLPYLEDVRFYEALQQHDARIRHCPQVRVVTSTRTEGRVDFGFSRQLQQWATMQRTRQPMIVPGAEEWRCWFVLQRKLRVAWQLKSYIKLVETQAETEAPVIAFYADMMASRYFGAFLHRVMRSDSLLAWMAHRYKPVAVAEAIQQLRAVLREYEPSAGPDRRPVTPLPRDPVGTVLLADDADVVAGR